jgi:hypothetical protein
MAQERLAQSPGGRPLRAEDAARLLEHWLRDSGEFEYSLDLSIEDPELDPVVDFLVNRRAGHCEYFASALAVMLRGVGIPARLVSGFKGGVWNPTTGQLEVRQLHAHAWVEAGVESGWISLDPTPEAREASVDQIEARTQGLWSSWREAWERTWNNGIRLSRAEQDELVYRPFRDSFTNLWTSLSDVRGTAGGLLGLFRSLFESPQRWFSWRGGLAVFLLLSAGAACVWLARRIWGTVRALRASRGESGRGNSTIEFYERFRKLASRAGLERPQTQTQREFADHVEHALASRRDGDGVRKTPGFVTNDFYRVRFGEETLSDDERQALSARLDALELCLQQAPAGRGLT